MADTQLFLFRLRVVTPCSGRTSGPSFLEGMFPRLASGASGSTPDDEPDLDTGRMFALLRARPIVQAIPRDVPFPR